MTITQTVTIPDNHRLTIDVPREIPAGPIIISFSSVAEQKSDVVLKMSAEQEIETINQNADRLNSEALDVLSYQDIDL